MPYPRVLRALKSLERSQWPLADAVLAEVAVKDGRAATGELERCRAWLEQQGYDTTTDRLGTVRRMAEVYDTPQSRRHEVSFRHYQEAMRKDGTARQRDSWLAKAAREHMTLRQFHTHLFGTQWSVPPAPEVAEAIAKNPQVVVEAIRNSPELADALVSDMDAHHAVVQAAGRHTARHMATPDPLDEMANRKGPDLQWAERYSSAMLNAETNVHAALRALRNLPKGYFIAPQAKADDVARANRIMFACEAIKAALEGTDVAAEAAEFLEFLSPNQEKGNQ